LRNKSNPALFALLSQIQSLAGYLPSRPRDLSAGRTADLSPFGHQHDLFLTVRGYAVGPNATNPLFWGEAPALTALVPSSWASNNNTLE
jgi:hypothetical protein